MCFLALSPWFLRLHVQGSLLSLRDTDLGSGTFYVLLTFLTDTFTLYLLPPLPGNCFSWQPQEDTAFCCIIIVGPLGFLHEPPSIAILHLLLGPLGSSTEIGGHGSPWSPGNSLVPVVGGAPYNL